MPAGDASRTWFSEMIEALRQEWKPEMAWEQVIALRDRLDAMLKDIRFSRGIRPPTMWCPVCNRQTQQLRRASRFELFYSRLVVLALLPQRKSSRWRSAGQSTGRKTALIEMVSPTRLYPQVPNVRSRTVIRTVLPDDITSTLAETSSAKHERRVGGWKIYPRRQRVLTEIGCDLLGRWAADASSVWRLEDC